MTIRDNLVKKKAVVLLSGGLDSAVTLFMAVKRGYVCTCLVFDYGQRQLKELRSAAIIAGMAGADIKIERIDLSWKGSSLLDKDIEIPTGRSAAEIGRGGIPSTYVPARNTIFLSVASSLAEAIGAQRIFIGAHSEDSSGYPDCRMVYLAAFDKVIRLGTKCGLEGKLRLEYPLIDKTKAGIIKLGFSLGVPLGVTWSCYNGAKKPCLICDSCVLRAKGFREAGMADPALEGK